LPGVVAAVAECAPVVGEAVFEAAVEAVAAAVGDAPTSH
jgi:hypothetical protein